MHESASSEQQGIVGPRKHVERIDEFPEAQAVVVSGGIKSGASEKKEKACAAHEDDGPEPRRRFRHVIRAAKQRLFTPDVWKSIRSELPIVATYALGGPFIGRRAFLRELVVRPTAAASAVALDDGTNVQFNT